ncbi:MAG TPA: hypothetical protein VNP04_21965 [Alphaproteobacteria bacterium]|nr:hypothetical protein [Alphaproteobacteria bacterium]
MAVKVVIKETGETITGKFASLEADKVSLYAGIMPDKKGRFRGCGKKRVFDMAAVMLAADDPDKELKRR